MTRIKGIKVNGNICDLDLSRIGSVVHDTNGGLIGPDTELVEYINSHSGDTPSSGTTELTSADGTKFLLKVYDDGTLYADEQITDAITPQVPTTDTIVDLAADVKKLYINSFYCGGLDADIHTLNYCSHNFVELCNLTNNDVKLDGISLLYLKGGASAWDSYPLSGVIKKGSTFLIRGAQCSNIDGAKIVVDDYDLEIPNFRLSITESPSLYLRFNTTVAPPINPGWDTFTNVEKYFIDLVGVNGNPANCSAYMADPYAYDRSTLNEVIFRRYYAMDGVSQGNKDLKAMNNSTEWCYVDLTKDDGDLIPSIEDNAPKARIDGKNLYFDKTKLFESKPTVMTCSFGIEAIDNGSGATRCFNWVSKGRHDEFIWIRKKGTSSWREAHESFKTGSLDPEYARFGELAKYYNRQHIEYADGVVFTAHKYIKHGLEAGVYEYIAGRANRKGEPILNQCTEVREFTVRTFDQVKNGFKYVQTSDQQGFNWNEYRIWQAAGETIEREDDSEYPIQFMINTGDMTQNGSRMNEWIDYFDGKGKFLNNMEEMATVGNNDLSGKETYTIPGGGDATKLSPYNFNYFYTYEMDIDNAPVFTVPVTGGTENATYYIPSLYSFNYGNTHFMCLDSEIKAIAEGPIFGCGTTGNFYPQIKTWCENDIEKYTREWNVAFCHELPFHIMTTGMTRPLPDDKSSECVYDSVIAKEINDGSEGNGAGRSGASSNTNIAKNIAGKGTPRFWFSEFCQTHNIRLVMGGHKHTQATSWPLLENVVYDGEVRSVRSWRPIIVLDNNINKISDYDNNATSLISAWVYLKDGEHKTAGQDYYLKYQAKYPDTWTETDEGEVRVKEAFTGQAAFCEFEMLSELPAGTKPVVYAMSQATSYKHTSNKELPSSVIPWSRYLYPTKNGDTKPNAGQKYPFYTIWTVDTASKITGEVRKVVGAFDENGKFDINKDGPYVLNGKSAIDGQHGQDIASVNGLGVNVPTSSEEKTIILK